VEHNLGHIFLTFPDKYSAAANKNSSRLQLRGAFAGSQLPLTKKAAELTCSLFTLLQFRNHPHCADVSGSYLHSFNTNTRGIVLSRTIPVNYFSANHDLCLNTNSTNPALMGQRTCF
jgi:hypothetical protein